MKRVMILINLCWFAVAWSQAPENRHEEFLKAKKTFIAEKLALSPAEEQKFWPVFDAYELKKMELFKQNMELRRKIKGLPDEASEAEMIVLADKMIEQEKAELQLRVDYHKKFKAVLSARKLLNFYRAENQYKTNLIRNYKGHHKPQAQRPEKGGPCTVPVN